MRQFFLFIAFIFVSCSDNSSSKIPVEQVSQSAELIRKISIDSLLMITDSVIIVSHESTNYPIRDTITGKLETPELIIDNEPNLKIIHEKKELTKNDGSLLKDILTAQIIKEEKATTTCFQPRHAVFFYQRGKLSYIDFCFECVGFTVSSDILYNNLKFDTEKWERLRLFFISQGFYYELL